MREMLRGSCRTSSLPLCAVAVRVDNVGIQDVAVIVQPEPPDAGEAELALLARQEPEQHGVRIAGPLHPAIDASFPILQRDAQRAFILLDVVDAGYRDGDDPLET